MEPDDTFPTSPLPISIRDLLYFRGVEAAGKDLS